MNTRSFDKKLNALKSVVERLESWKQKITEVIPDVLETLKEKYQLDFKESDIHIKAEKRGGDIYSWCFIKLDRNKFDVNKKWEEFVSEKYKITLTYNVSEIYIEV